jgi:hypothetical protein
LGKGAKIYLLAFMLGFRHAYAPEMFIEPHKHLVNQRFYSGICLARVPHQKQEHDMNKLTLTLTGVLALPALSLADQETTIEITEDDGELNIETESDSDGASALSPNIDVRVGNHQRSQHQERDALIDAKLRALEAQDRASHAERAAASAEASAREAEIARFEAEAHARQAGRSGIQSSTIEYRTLRPPGDNVEVIERYEEVRERTWR